MFIPVPGSEFFDYPVNPPEVIRQKISPKLKLHTVSEELLRKVDPVTYEVVRHRIWAISDEMGETMKRMTGSIVVAECNDFNIGIMDEIGEIVQVGLYNTEVSAAMDMLPKWMLENRSENPGIDEGDMFFSNDPWIGGGLHQSDVTVSAPLFWEGELFCWSQASCHEVDVGGTIPGGLAIFGDSVFYEAQPQPPLKIVRKGEFQQDVEDVYLRRSRIPMLNALDLRAQIGANNIAHERFRALIKKYGAGTVKAVMRLMMDEAEQKLRAKLKSLPDGTWTSFIYQEQAKLGDRGIYKIALIMTKKGDHLTFDFRGTDPQVEMIRNCTYAGLRGGLLGGVLPSLCGDIPWAPGGIFRCFDIVSEKGTLNNCLFPAGISRAPIDSAWVTGLVAIECISKMLNTTAELRKNVWAGCIGTWATMLVAGLDQRASPPMPFLFANLDPMAGGLGARTDKDGVDTGGLHLIPMGLIPDVEMQEYTYPILYLWRREEADSGGPGKYRGGLSPSDCIICYGNEIPTQLVSCGSGKAISMNIGLSGGYPGHTALDKLLCETNVRELLKKGVIPSSLEEIQSKKVEILQPMAMSYLGPKDVYYFNWQGGAGYMDPLLRDPTLVLTDLRERKVSIETARTIYGVVVNPGTLEINENETKQTRSKIIEERKRKAKKPDLPNQSSNHRIEVKTEARLQDVDENVKITEENGKRVLKCVHCGYTIADADQNYPDHLLFYEGHVSEAGPQIYPHPEHYVDAKVVFRQYYCPGCYIAFITQVVPVS